MKTLKVGFTGTQEGMTNEQWKTVFSFMERLAKTYNLEGHHGDCIGADSDFHSICRILGARVETHPPDNPVKRAYCEADASHKEKPYLVRNQDIVNVSGILFGTPRETKEQLRSGTWSTIRKGRKRVDIPVVIVRPDGVSSIFNIEALRVLTNTKAVD